MIVVIIILVLVIIISFICYYITFYSPHRGDGNHYSVPSGEQYQCIKSTMRRLIDEFLELDSEEIEIISRDGLKLSGKYYHVCDGAPVDICFHGYRGTAARDFCGGARIPLEMGHNMIVVDQRAQGKSQGHSICFGIKERYDCLSWINYVLCRFGMGTRIHIFGVSMGAATVLMAAGLGLPENVRCVIADCPYSEVPAIIRKVCRDRKLPDTLFYPFIWLGAYLFAGIKLEDGDCVNAVKNSSVPMLIIHGEEDHFVPCYMSHEIHNSRPDIVSLSTFPGAGHGISYIVDKPRYEKLVHDFIKNL